MMKGLEALGIDMIDLDNDNVPEHDWFEEVSTHLVSTQEAAGSWPWDCWGNPVLSTAWALLTLERSVPPLPPAIYIDIKPQSCPNPLNVRNQGVLPVAILGSENFDVGMIDVSSIRLADVAPIRSSIEDVSIPSEGDECECTTEAGDGFDDLTVKFNTQDIVDALGEVVNGETLVLTLTGELSDGTPIEGADCIRVKKPRAKK